MLPEDFDEFKKEMLNQHPGGGSYFDHLAKRQKELNPEKNKPKGGIGKSLGGVVTFGGILLGFVVFIWLYSIFSYGFVITCMWKWFVVPIFPAASEIKFGIVQAMGILLFIRFFTIDYYYNAKSDKDKTFSDRVVCLIFPLVFPWVSLLFAWLLTLLL